MKSLLITLILILPALTYSQDRKCIQMERQSSNEWNLYEIDMSDFYNMYNAGGVNEYYLDWTTSPTYNWDMDYTTLDQGTIINLFDDSEGYLKYTESIYIENTKLEFWEIEWQKTQIDMISPIHSLPEIDW